MADASAGDTKRVVTALPWLFGAGSCMLLLLCLGVLQDAARQQCAYIVCMLGGGVQSNVQ
jgi:hypothetical protein